MIVKVEEVEPHVYKIRLWSYIKLAIASAFGYKRSGIKPPFLSLDEGDILIYGRKRFLFKKEEHFCGCMGCDLCRRKYWALCYHVACGNFYILRVK